MAQCRLLWASLDLCQPSWKSRCNKSKLNTRCCFSSDLSWVNQVQEPQSHRHSWAPPQHRALTATSRTGQRARSNKPFLTDISPYLSNASPRVFFPTAARLRFSGGFCLENELHSLGYSMQQEGCCSYPSVRLEKLFLRCQCRSVPNQDLAQTQKSHFHILFSATKLVSSPFHQAEWQTLLTLALLLQEVLVGQQLEITPYFNRVTKSRPWLLLLPAPL